MLVMFITINQCSFVTFFRLKLLLTVSLSLF